jgi:hypothetical protein
MHGRQSGESRCLAYWLEFKNDDEFAGNRFGGIGGGSALKFVSCDQIPIQKKTIDAAQVAECRLGRGWR